MEIFHISAECYPVAKVGGLADVVGALPKYQKKAGHDAIVVIPFKAKAAAKDFELSSTFQPVMSRVAFPLLVTSNQSAPTKALLLDQGATSVMLTVAIAATSSITSVIVKLNSTEASGVEPTELSSTFKVIE